MLVAYDAKGVRKVASDKLKGSSFSCPDCLQEVGVRVGEKRVPHFAHKIGQACNGEQLRLSRKKAAALRRLNKVTEKREANGQASLFEDFDLSASRS